MTTIIKNRATISNEKKERSILALNNKGGEQHQMKTVEQHASDFVAKMAIVL